MIVQFSRVESRARTNTAGDHERCSSAALIIGYSRRNLGVGIAFSVVIIRDSQFRYTFAMMRNGPLAGAIIERSSKVR